MVGKAYEEAGMIKHGSKMIQAVTSATRAADHDLLRRVVRRRQLRHVRARLPSALLFSWPNAKTAVMGGEQAAETMAIVTEAAARGAASRSRRKSSMR
jgi:geranyl-CoA carboxylase beta subunit